MTPIELHDVLKQRAEDINRVAGPKLKAQLSLALVERDRARTDALEEAAKLCIAIRDANFANLPDYETEPDFSTEDVTSEDVCAWHIRAAKARNSPAPIPAQATDR